MKAAGILLLFCAFLLTGVLAVREKRARIRALGELCAALELTEGELKLRDASLADLCGILKKRAPGVGGRLFKLLGAAIVFLGDEDFPAIWSRVVGGCCGMLRTGERDELLALGAILGRYDTDTQILAIRGCRSALQRKRDDALRSYASDRKLWLGLSASAGFLAAILLT